MKRDKRLWGKHCLALLVLMFMIGMELPQIVQASGGTNNTYLTADQIYANTTIVGTTPKGDQVDYYKYTVTEPGYFTVSLSRAGSRGQWILGINDSKNVKIEKTGYRSSYETAVYNFGVGESIYIMVQGSNNEEYALTVNTTPASDWEQEPDDDRSAAISIQDGEWLTGNGYKRNDDDWYMYTVQKRGYLSFEMEQVDEGSYSWAVEVEDDGQNRLERATVKDGFQSGKYCGAIGQTFYLHIESGIYNRRRYQVRAVFTEADDWEKETNDTLKDATVIKTAQTLHGVLNKDNDVDMYQFKSPGSGVYSFNVSGVDGDSRTYWKVSLYDAKNKLIQTEKALPNQEQQMRRLNFKKGEVVYLKVEKGYAMSGREYTVTMNYEKNGSWEQESNDTFKTAVALKKGKTKIGTCYAVTDQDYYVYKASKAGMIKFTFTGDQVDYGNGWDVTVYDQNKKVVKEIRRLKDSQTIGVKAKRGRNYYLVVKPGDSKMVDISYEITVK